MKSGQPLAGKRIVVTRSRQQASELTARLAALGADVLELPLIRVTPEIDKQDLADVMLEFGSYDWIVFTSANGVRHFFDQFFRLFDDIRSMGFLRIACVGDATAAEIRALRLRVECQPKVATAEKLAAALIETGSIENGKLLVITGNLNRDALVTELEKAGGLVDQLQVYKTELVDLSADPAAGRFRREGADAILFASSSAVQGFAGQAHALQRAPDARRPLAGSIGPQTSATMREIGMKPDFEAETPGIDAFIAALLQRLSGRKPE